MWAHSAVAICHWAKGHQTILSGSGGYRFCGYTTRLATNNMHGHLIFAYVCLTKDNINHTTTV